jgi:hypothetical protein
VFTPDLNEQQPRRGGLLRRLLPLAGTALGGPLGGLAVAGGLTLATHLLGKKRSPQQAPGSSRMQTLASLYQSDASAPLTSNSAYQAGLSELHREQEREAAADAGDLAARGLRGGEMEVALRARRGREAVAARGGLLRMATAARDAARQGLLGVAGMEQQQEQYQQHRRDSRRQGLLSALGGAAGNAAYAWATRGGGS